MPRYTKLVESLPSTVPFVGPESLERETGLAFNARIGANESVFGPSPRAIEAMKNAATQVWKYADPENHDLKEALAEHYNLPPENIMIGEGIDGLLGLLVRMLVNQGDPVVTSLGAYPTFNFHVSGFGGRLETVPYKNDAEDTDALLATTKQQNAKLTYLANPDNPMGSWHSAGTVQDMIDQFPMDGLLCLDEAYGEFAPENVLLPFDVEEKRVIRMRTFSKAYGMAGARIAYAIAHADLVNAFNKVRNHFGVNRIAQEGALAALQDQDWLHQVKAEVAAANARIAEIAIANGLSPLPTAANFVTIDCGRDSLYSKALVAELGKRRVFVRMPFVEPQNRCIRVSSGTKADLDELERALPKALKAIG